MFQNQLPENGAPLLPPRALTTRTLPQLFHDHVIDQVNVKGIENIKYLTRDIAVDSLTHGAEGEILNRPKTDLL